MWKHFTIASKNHCIIGTLKSRKLNYKPKPAWVAGRANTQYETSITRTSSMKIDYLYPAAGDDSRKLILHAQHCMNTIQPVTRNISA